MVGWWENFDVYSSFFLVLVVDESQRRELEKFVCLAYSGQMSYAGKLNFWRIFESMQSSLWAGVVYAFLRRLPYSLGIRTWDLVCYVASGMITK